MSTDSIHDAVRSYYLRAAEGGADRDVDVLSDDRWGAHLYDDESIVHVPKAAADLSMGCGNPYLLADLTNGETVLDLGSGGGIDVILSARRVAPDGMAYGLDMLQEMVDIASKNAADAGVSNVRFLQGLMERVPLADGSVDVVISNCVISLAPDKTPVFAEMFRVLRQGGRMAVSDVVAGDEPLPDVEGEEWVACGAGALGKAEFIEMLTEAGFTNISIETTHDVGHGRKAAMIRADRS